MSFVDKHLFSINMQHMNTRMHISHAREGRDPRTHVEINDSLFQIRHAYLSLGSHKYLGHNFETASPQLLQDTQLLSLKRTLNHSTRNRVLCPMFYFIIYNINNTNTYVYFKVLQKVPSLDLCIDFTYDPNTSLTL